ncbi:hypothetical protein [Rummeliibacillus sp. TYF-LIM-RU47]|uniref:hypothetical protein n=1 Tax=Rummeliibacillus sp. TYF-LIM-RU47 TaxID=2608406 RepID=UPI001239B06D|nr:hypothetical protein [Rummeliibacillus sp. TYF-LIM-RU47]
MTFYCTYKVEEISCDCTVGKYLERATEGGKVVPFFPNGQAIGIMFGEHYTVKNSEGETILLGSKGITELESRLAKFPHKFATINGKPLECYKTEVAPLIYHLLSKIDLETNIFYAVLQAEKNNHSQGYWEIYGFYDEIVEQLSRILNDAREQHYLIYENDLKFVEIPENDAVNQSNTFDRAKLSRKLTKFKAEKRKELQYEREKSCI